MTGCAPAQLIGGGRAYFDALLEKAEQRSQIGYDSTELLAQLVEINFAMYRALLAMGGNKQIPDQHRVRRPGTSRQQTVNWRHLAGRLGGARGN